MRLDAALFFSLVPIAGLAMVAPRVASDWMARPSVQVASTTTAQPNPRPMLSGGARVRARGDGHFQVEAKIGARRIPFMVDTGATLVALRWETGRDLGLVNPSDPMTVPISTANGTLQAKRIVLDRLDVEGIEVENVPALVLPQGALAANLLGMSFLSRLGHFEIADGELMLEK